MFSGLSEANASKILKKCLFRTTYIVTYYRLAIVKELTGTINQSIYMFLVSGPGRWNHEIPEFYIISFPWRCFVWICESTKTWLESSTSPKKLSEKIKAELPEGASGPIRRHFGTDTHALQDPNIPPIEVFSLCENTIIGQKGLNGLRHTHA